MSGRKSCMGRGSRLVRLRSAVFSAALLSATVVPPAQANPGGWEVKEERSPLTNLTTVSAVLSSSNAIVNMIGRSENASLVLRCQDRTLVVYLNWAEVLNYDSSNFAGQPKTFAVWRIDNGVIKSNFWTIADGGTAAGEFGSRGATKLLSTLVGAKQLAVRLSGRMTQDAGFDLTGIDEVATGVAGACGIALVPAK